MRVSSRVGFGLAALAALSLSLNCNGPAAASAPAVTPAAVTPAATLAVTPTVQVDGMRQDVATLYEVDPDAVVTRVTLDVTLSHERPDRTDASWTFPSYSVTVPTEASELTASVDGEPVAVSRQPVPDTGAAEWASVSLDPAMRYGQVRHVRYSYELGPQPDREDAWSQANEAFFMFPVWLVGDPGSAEVEVRVPDSYAVDVIGDDMSLTSEAAHTVLSAQGGAAPQGFQAMVLASDESLLVTEQVDSPVGPLVLRAWPGHDQWVTFVVDHVKEGVPVLTELTGQSWDAERTLVIEETMTPFAQGYGGWYDPAEHTIRIGDQLDGHLVLHELTHVWVNFDVFAERWLVEGFAEHLAATALAHMGETESAHTRPTAADLPVEPPLPLGEWDTPAIRAEANQEVEDFGYAASWHVVGSIADEVGAERTRSVIGAAVGREVTYLGSGEPEVMTAPYTWRQALDLFENLAGSETAAELFATYVVSPEQVATFDQRALARDTYEALAERGGTWLPPFEVRRHMARWDFDAAVEVMPDAHAVLDVREGIAVDLDGLAEEHRLDVDELGLASQYDTATDVDELVGRAEQTRDAVDAYRAAVDHRPDGGLLASVGLWGTDLDRDRARVREALADGEPEDALQRSAMLVERMDGAARQGAVRLAVATVVVVMGAGVAVRVLRARRRAAADSAQLQPPG